MLQTLFFFERKINSGCFLPLITYFHLFKFQFRIGSFGQQSFSFSIQLYDYKQDKRYFNRIQPPGAKHCVIWWLHLFVFFFTFMEKKNHDFSSPWLSFNKKSVNQIWLRHQSISIWRDKIQMSSPHRSSWQGDKVTIFASTSAISLLFINRDRVLHSFHRVESKFCCCVAYLS